MIKLSDAALECEEIGYLYDTLGPLIGERVEIPEGRRIGQ